MTCTQITLWWSNVERKSSQYCNLKRGFVLIVLSASLNMCKNRPHSIVAYVWGEKKKSHRPKAEQPGVSIYGCLRLQSVCIQQLIYWGSGSLCSQLLDWSWYWTSRLSLPVKGEQFRGRTCVWSLSAQKKCQCSDVDHTIFTLAAVL